MTEQQAPNLEAEKNAEKDTGIPPQEVYRFHEPSYKNDTIEPNTDGLWEAGLPIIIDMGTYQTRAGYATQKGPGYNFPTLYSKFRDRKISRSYSLIGSSVYLDTNSRSNIRSPFDGSIISNWESAELLLDYTFHKLGVKSEGSVDNPVVMTEIPGCPAAQRKNFNELFFEAYNVQSVAWGIDSLFSYYYNEGNNGIVVSSGHESTHVIPVVQGKGLLSLSKRINWGGHQSATYMQNLLNLKYPYFPSKVTLGQATFLVHDHCYVSKDYAYELANFLNFDGLEKRERVIQAPYTEAPVNEKSEEELRQIEERRKESGRRLQEQAAKQRLEKLMQKENDLEYYRQLQARIDEATNKKDVKKILDREGFKDQAALTKVMNDLNRAIKRARKEDVGEEEEAEVPTFPLLEIPDDKLDPDQIKEKRKQRLMKANYDARMRAKEEKLKEKARLEEEERKEAEWRERDLEGWIATRKQEREQLLQTIKEKQRLKADLQDRKSLASQMRMKNIAALMNDNKRGKRRRGGAAAGDDDPDDNFGADDDDWNAYQDIKNESDGEEEEEAQKEIKRLEELLLKYDPNFTIEDTKEAQKDWRKSIVHLFLHGPRPFDPDSIEQQHRMVLNVERIRVPEVIFQPSIAGVDQAGVTEILDSLLNRQLDSEVRQGVSQEVLKDIFLTGGQALFKNIDERIQIDLQASLPTGAPLRVRRAKDPMLDAWKGMALFARNSDRSKTFLTRKQYLEMGHHYLLEHQYSNDFF